MLSVLEAQVIFAAGVISTTAVMGFAGIAIAFKDARFHWWKLAIMLTVLAGVSVGALVSDLTAVQANLGLGGLIVGTVLFLGMSLMAAVRKARLIAAEQQKEKEVQMRKAATPITLRTQPLRSSTGRSYVLGPPTSPSSLPPTISIVTTGRRGI